MNIILLGAPGSGKGTTSELLVEKNNFFQLSTGDLFRKNISEKTKLGLEAQEYMNQGKYVPDEVTNSMVNDYLKTNSDQQIFDGFPRTLEQAKALDKMLSDLGKQIDKVLHIDLEQEALMQRLVGRLICNKCKRSYHIVNRKPKTNGVCDFDGEKLITRPDDQEDKIKIRLEEYNTLTLPLIDYYKNQNKLVNIKATNLSTNQVYELISESLK